MQLTCPGWHCHWSAVYQWLAECPTSETHNVNGYGTPDWSENTHVTPNILWNHHQDFTVEVDQDGSQCKLLSNHIQITNRKTSKSSKGYMWRLVTGKIKSYHQLHHKIRISDIGFSFNIDIYHTPHLSCSLTEHSIDEGHNGSLQIHFISVATCGFIQVCHQGLHTKKKAGKLCNCYLYKL